MEVWTGPQTVEHTEHTSVAARDLGPDPKSIGHQG